MRPPGTLFGTRVGAPRSSDAVSSSSDPILDAQGVHKRYGGVHALRGARLTVYPSEVHALLGENGSGKSTLLKILSGQVQRDSGEIMLGGKPMHVRNAMEALRQGIATVTQETQVECVDGRYVNTGFPPRHAKDFASVATPRKTKSCDVSGQISVRAILTRSNFFDAIETVLQRSNGDH